MQEHNEWRGETERGSGRSIKWIGYSVGSTECIGMEAWQQEIGSTWQAAYSIVGSRARATSSRPKGTKPPGTSDTIACQCPPQQWILA